jgi:predicted secreted protein
MGGIGRARSARTTTAASAPHCVAVAKRRRRVGAVGTVAIGLAGLLFAGAVAAGCGAQQISLSSKDNGTTIKASDGDTIVLKLDENPTTGYHWVMKFGDGLRLTSDGYKQQADTQNLVGAGGTHTWTIDVTGSGKPTISGTYEPPGTPNTSPQRFSLTVDVI